MELRALITIVPRVSMLAEIIGEILVGEVVKFWVYLSNWAFHCEFVTETLSLLLLNDLRRVDSLIRWIYFTF
jgi:hypothetical protein